MRWSHFGRGQVILMRFFIIFMKKKPHFLCKLHIYCLWWTQRDSKGWNILLSVMLFWFVVLCSLSHTCNVTFSQAHTFLHSGCNLLFIIISFQSKGAAKAALQLWSLVYNNFVFHFPISKLKKYFLVFLNRKFNAPLSIKVSWQMWEHLHPCIYGGL
jgi:hypothetical protein